MAQGKDETGIAKNGQRLYNNIDLIYIQFKIRSWSQMESLEFLLTCDKDGDTVIADANRSVELQAVEFFAAGWMDRFGCIIELFTAEDYRNRMDKIKGLPPEKQRCLDFYFATTCRIWDDERTQIVIPAFLCEYAGITDKVFYFETEDGHKYLCGSKPE